MAWICFHLCCNLLFTQLVQHMVSEQVGQNFTLFEKNLQELHDRVMNIEKGTKQQVGGCSWLYIQTHICIHCVCKDSSFINQHPFQFQIHKLSRQLQMAKEDSISRNASMVDANAATVITTTTTTTTTRTIPSNNNTNNNVCFS